MPKPFQTVSSLNPGRSQFDLSYEKKFTCDMGQLIPVCHDLLMPGDFFKIAAECVIRFQPLVSPVLHEINMFVHYFFVPLRLLWNAKTREDLTETGDWEDFITGGEDGTNSDTIPTWSPTSSSDKGTLWDYMGMPLVADPDGYLPIDFPRRAYNLIYHEYYRDENLIAAGVDWQNDDILLRAWEKDYFTSMLPWLLRGTAPALPISGNVPVEGIGMENQTFGTSNQNVYETGGAGTVQYATAKYIDPSVANRNVFVEQDPSNAGFPNIRADLSAGTTFDVADLRLAFQVQKWMERNARAGIRYVEFLKSHYGIAPRDDRLQRPEYIGGMKAPIIVSEVLQTESSDASTPQGTMSGHGLGVGRNYIGKYMAKEFGVLMGIFSVMPKPVYNTQGINRQWMYETKYDFPFPEFVNLSEQAVETGEVWVETGDSSVSETILGYQGRYDEHRIKHSIVCDDMRDTFDYWHISRQFSAAPTLNQTFIECNPRKDIFAVPSDPGLVVSYANIISAFRPIPVQAEPGLIDH